MRFFFYIAVLLLVMACQPGEQPPVANRTSGPLKVVAVNYPLQYFAERIGGEHARVRLAAPKGVDPADWLPEQGKLRAFISDMQMMDLIILNGANYAKWVKLGSWRESQMVHTATEFKESFLEVKEEFRRDRHKHGKGQEHSHTGLAYTVWLDPLLAMRQAKAIHDAFANARPQHQKLFTKKLEKLKADLEGLGADLPVIKTPLLASHPVYQYLEKRIGLNLLSVHWEPDEIPPAEEWERLKEKMKTHPAKWMLWEKDPLPETAKKLREIGVESVLFDPCGSKPRDGDYLSIMRANFSRLQQALRSN